MRRFGFVLILALAGCGGAGHGGLLGGGGSSCSPHTFTLNFPSVSGYSATGSITSASGCFSSATVSTQASTGPVLGTPFTSNDSTMQVHLYLGASFSVAEYATGMPALSVTLPSSVVTTGRKFYVATNRGGGTLFGWTAAVEGPVTASGGMLSFSSGGGNVTFTANEDDELAVYSVAGP